MIFYYCRDRKRYYQNYIEVWNPNRDANSMQTSLRNEIYENSFQNLKTIKKKTYQYNDDAWGKKIEIIYSNDKRVLFIKV